MNSESLGVDGTKNAHLVERLVGRPPEPTIVRPNPAFESWVEKAALRLCLDAEECGVIPTPCSAHLSEARRIAAHLSIRVAN